MFQKLQERMTPRFCYWAEVDQELKHLTFPRTKGLFRPEETHLRESDASRTPAEIQLFDKGTQD